MTEEQTKIVQAVMFGLSAILPLIGFLRLLWRSSRALSEVNMLIKERGHSAVTLDDFGKANSDISTKPKEERKNLIWDVVFVGTGLALGALASIWSLKI
jgi:hypothetical protein